MQTTKQDHTKTPLIRDYKEKPKTDVPAFLIQVLGHIRNDTHYELYGKPECRVEYDESIKCKD